MTEGESSAGATRSADQGLPGRLALPETTAFRVVTRQAALLGLVLGLLALLFALLGTRELVAELDFGLRDEARELAAIDAAGGSDALREALARRTEKVGERSPLLALREAGVVVAGNVSEWPASLGPEPAWVALVSQRPRRGELDGDGSRPRRHGARALLIGLGPDRELLLGRDTSRFDLLRSPVLGLALSTVLATAVLSLGAGVLIGRRLILPLRRLVDGLESVGGGEAGRRLPIEGRRDEFAVLAEAVNAMLERIEQLVADQRTVNESIAHDLRYPLARARDDLADPAGSEAARERALEAVSAALHAFDALLDLRTLGSAALVEGFAAVRPATLLADVAEFYEPLLEEQGMSLEVRAPADAVVRGDADLLFRVLANLVENAVQHGRGGHLVLDAAVAAGSCCITLREGGPRREVPADSAGHGLGLALADRILLVHGGRLEIEEREEGRVTRLHLPADSA